MVKYFLLLSSLSLFSTGLFAQTYVNLDSARELVQSKSGEERFRGLRSITRYYYTTGMFDSSEIETINWCRVAKQCFLPQF